MVLEIIIYLFVAFGILMLTMTVFENSLCIKKGKCFVLDKEDKKRINITIRVESVSDEKIEEIKRVLTKGEYINIYDFVDTLEIEKCEKKEA